MTDQPLRFQRDANQFIPCWGDDCRTSPTHAAAVLHRGELTLIVYACDRHKDEWEGRRPATIERNSDGLNRLTVR